LAPQLLVLLTVGQVPPATAADPDAAAACATMTGAGHPLHQLQFHHYHLQQHHSTSDLLLASLLVC
jgi:hypothetical protein